MNMPQANQGVPDEAFPAAAPTERPPGGIEEKFPDESEQEQRPCRGPGSIGDSRRNVMQALGGEGQPAAPLVIPDDFPVEYVPPAVLARINPLTLLQPHEARALSYYRKHRSRLGLDAVDLNGEMTDRFSYPQVL